MGLLDKTLKKAGLERKPAEKSAPAKTNSPVSEDKPAVSWLGRSFSERARALAVKVNQAENVNLEQQYAHLENLASASDLPPPPKASLRERARKFISGFSQPRLPVEAADEPPKRSLRARAQRFIKKLAGGGGDDSGGSAPISGGTSSGTAAPTDPTSHLDAHELPEPAFFPWFALTEEGDIASQVAFGEEPHPEHLNTPAAAPEVLPAAKEEQSTLEKFAETVERISENLKNLHVQLDTTSLIRETRKVTSTEAGTTASASDSTSPLISHHVSDAAAAIDPAQSAEGGNRASQKSAEQVSPTDVFWPKNLPLELPSRDIKFNADGSMSVVPGPFQLPYLADDIAPPESEISHFTRNLKNAELFIAEGELQLTRIIYDRLLVQIIDDEARRKIRANLEALDSYKKSHDWGNFMPLPPWMQRNPWEHNPPRLNIPEMPVEAKNITINMDKGFFEIARAIFELKDTILEKKKDADSKEDLDAAAKGEVAAEDDKPDDSDGKEEGDQRVAEGDRRQGAPDPRGEGAADRRSGKGRREADLAPKAEEAPAEEGDGAADDANKPPEPLAADGSAAPPQQAEEEPATQPLPDGLLEEPKMPEMAPDGQASSAGEGDEGDDSGKEKEEENKVQEIRGVLELKTPDQEDTPFLTLTYDFTKIPHAYRLAKDNGIFEYAYYKYKPMLVKAHQFIKRKQITRALNYYRVIREQQIPTEFRHMVDRNIKDITEYLQKYLVTRAG